VAITTEKRCATAMTRVRTSSGTPSSALITRDGAPERGAKAVEGHNLIVEIEDRLPLQRCALVVELLRRQADRDDEAA
jgi:hypothetical protein